MCIYLKIGRNWKYHLRFSHLMILKLKFPMIDFKNMLITKRMFVFTCIENKISFWLFFQELTEENRVLNRLVKRQGVVLDRLASNNGELPTLLYAHNEEIRVTRQRMKQVRTMKSRCLLSFFSLPSTYILFFYDIFIIWRQKHK